MPTRTLCSYAVSAGNAPSDLCLRSAAGDIAHDLGLLTLAWDNRGSRLGWTTWFVTARSLDDLFFKKARKPLDKTGTRFEDDILAADFLTAGAWAVTATKLRKGAPPEAARMRRAANKLSAHLTYSRADIRSAGGLPPSEAVHRFLLGVATVWLAALPPERRVLFGGSP